MSAMKDHAIEQMNLGRSRFIVQHRSREKVQFMAMTETGRHYLSPVLQEAVTFSTHAEAMTEVVWNIQHRKDWQTGIMTVIELTD